MGEAAGADRRAPGAAVRSVVIGRARAGAYRADVTVARIAPLGDDPPAGAGQRLSI